jgi:hypothetical protein
MQYDFSTEYSQRTDDELLHLASDRDALITEAAAALDAELRRRNLSESDRVQQQRFVKRQEQRETARRHRKTFGAYKDPSTWLDALWALLACALISFAYLALPRRYHMKPDWQEAAVYVMMTTVIIIIFCRTIFWRKFAFWVSLLISSVIHLVIVHAWTQRVPNLDRGSSKLAFLLGLFLFFAVYGFIRLLRQNFYGKDVT